MSGTSMAAGHVSGAVALYLVDHPNATPAQVEAAIVADAKDDVLSTRFNTTNKRLWVGNGAWHSTASKASN